MAPPGLRHRFPLRGERQHSPKFDGFYLATDDEPASSPMQVAQLGCSRHA
jgi:hypothetical protein